MPSKSKKIAEVLKPRTEFLELDDEDRKFLVPRVGRVVEGKGAEVEIEQYVGSILRRSGRAGARFSLDRACRKILVVPNADKSAATKDPVAVSR